MFTLGVVLRPNSTEGSGGSGSYAGGGTGTGGNYVPPIFLIMNLLGVYQPPVGAATLNLS